MNLEYVMVSIVMFLIALTAALSAYNIANNCKFFRVFGLDQIKNILCLPDIQYKAVELLIISVIVYSIIGLTLIIGGFKSKSQEGQMLRK